jgi:hypothetical protein
MGSTIEAEPKDGWKDERRRTMQRSRKVDVIRGIVLSQFRPACALRR